MNDVMRDRIMRKLQVLPEAQLYQVLDYIEFLEAKYAAGLARKPDGLQRFAERLEDGLRIRAVAPKVISGTVGVLGTARSVVRTVTDASRDLIDGVSEAARSAPATPPGGGSPRGAQEATPRAELPPAQPRTEPAAPPRTSTTDTGSTAGDTAGGRT